MARVAAVALVCTVALGLSGPAAPTPHTGELRLATTSDHGVKSNGQSREASVSADGFTVTFQSAATNLDPADADSGPDIYVKNTRTGDMRLASTSDDGTKGNGPSIFGFPASRRSLSADGTKVVFTSGATNLDPADRDAIFDVYVKDLATGEITLVSTSDTGVKGNSHNFLSAISGDGTRVAFISASSNLDSADADGVPDVYVKDLETGDIMLASTNDAGLKGNSPGASGSCSLSSDGTTVAFLSASSNLDPADTDSNIDVFTKNIVTGDLKLASTSDAGVKANAPGADFGGGVSLSADGMRVAFTAGSTNLDPGDSDNRFDVYVKDLSTGDIVIASTSSSGIKGNNASVRPSLAADGVEVAFVSVATNLDAGAGSDVYVKNLATGELRLASASASGVAGNSFDFDSALSADGTRVAFASASTNLHSGDSDATDDVYVKALVATDVTPPAIVGPADIDVDATTEHGVEVTYVAAAVDDVDGPVPVVCDPASGSTFPIGATSVSCTATDSAGNEASAGFVVRVHGAEAQLVRLQADVTGLEPGSSLVDKLEDIRAAVSNGDLATACAELNAFKHQLGAQAGKKLTVDQAAELAGRVDRIRRVIGC